MSRTLFDVADEVEALAVPVRDEVRVFSVGELAAAVKGRLEGAFPKVVVQGEISGAKLHSSGHFYFDLKDESAVLNGVAWKSVVARWKQVPANGTLVVATGKLTSYPARSTYQLMVEKLEPAGLGELMRQLEELKARLADEGLFDDERKRDIPFLPRRIGIITSPTGAVISDMLHRLEDRCPREVVLWGVAVQGASAAREIAEAVAGMNALPEDKRPDVLIVARGGGSFEDLMAFNSELVVRAIAASEIPVISGVGHEPDVTLCDYVADVRAPTPTAAAEMVVPVRDELLMMLREAARRLEMRVREMIADGRADVETLRKLLPDPMRLIVQGGQRLAELEERVRFVGPERVRRAREFLTGIERVMVAHNPKLPLEKGYVYLTRDGQMVRGAAQAAGEVTLHFIDGTREATVR